MSGTAALRMSGVLHVESCRENGKLARAYVEEGNRRSRPNLANDFPLMNVGVGRFELPTSRSRTVHSTKLSHTPPTSPHSITHAEVGRQMAAVL